MDHPYKHVVENWSEDHLRGLRWQVIANFCSAVPRPLFRFLCNRLGWQLMLPVIKFKSSAKCSEIFWTCWSNQEGHTGVDAAQWSFCLLTFLPGIASSRDAAPCLELEKLYVWQFRGWWEETTTVFGWGNKSGHGWTHHWVDDVWLRLELYIFGFAHCKWGRQAWYLGWVLSMPRTCHSGSCGTQTTS